MFLAYTEMKGGDTTESILGTVKDAMIGDAADDSFNFQLLTIINGIFFTLRQLVDHRVPAFHISGLTETWDDLAAAYELDDISAVRMYIVLKTTLLFDPPDRGFVVSAMEEQIKELEWRIREKEGWR